MRMLEIFGAANAPFDGEQQLPSGKGMEPPSQATFDDMLPDLPSINPDSQIDWVE